MSLVTLEEAKNHLRYDGEDNDAYINQLILTAEVVIERHVDDFEDVRGQKAYKQAALLLIGFWDDNRNAKNDENAGKGNQTNWYLPSPVLALLTPWRTPTGV